MAIKRFSGDKFTGLSTDVKPTNVLTGATFYETDTGLVFIYDSGWSEIGYTKPADLADVATSNDYNDLTNLPDLSALAEVESYTTQGNFPATGETGVVYIAEDTGYLYRWSGTAYVQLTDQTAIWGDISGTLSNQSDLQIALDDKADDTDVVKLTGAQTVGGVKTFSDSPIVPAPTTDLQAATKKYVDDNAGGGSSPAGASGDVQYNDGAGGLGADAALNYSSAGKEFLAPDFKIKESGEANTADANDEAVLKVTTEVVGPDTVVKVLGSIGNGDEVIIASYVA